ncbi:unnamed protein product [Vitrella brassicaformis CCMP3155]|uniref:MINDY deubiquitinase domain-containing protein n=1 Tax=Vitrella brassicaformis (strain CCMP3155) TaxID=1169540 RepID=A0A0G4E9A7_VITBC|nr:unnamed protein product [Vitrella brassicaformis CCMP3155]|eukprot:CEL92171.1 unnamed protein product [Vitrella brassicaformis CCMP3155]
MTAKAYRTKWIEFLGRKTPILMQAENGPCPLLAIANILLLRNRLQYPDGTKEVTFDALVQQVSNVLLDTNPRSASNAATDANFQQLISDVITILPRLNVGLDVNVRFTDCMAFEYTTELSVFDMLDCTLVHGWICSPQDHTTYQVVSSLSYNQLIERLITYRDLQSRIFRGSFDLDNLSPADSQPPAAASASASASAGSAAAAAAAAAAAPGSGASLGGGSPAGRTHRSRASEDGQPLPGSPRFDAQSTGNGSTAADSSTCVDQETGNLPNPEGERDLDVNSLRDRDDQFSLPASAAAATPSATSSAYPRAEEDGGGSSRRVAGPSLASLSLSAPAEDDMASSARRMALQEANEAGECSPKTAPSLAPSPVACAAFPNVDVPERAASDAPPTTSEEPEGEHEGEGEPGSSPALGGASMRSSRVGRGVSASTSSPSAAAAAGSGSGRPRAGSRSLSPTRGGGRSSSARGSGGSAGGGGGGGAPGPSMREIHQAMEEGEIIQAFLENTAAQMTYEGLEALHGTVRERQLCVFFRNNHFATVFKLDQTLYSLVTDEGYRDIPEVVWEKLNDIGGDTVFVNSNFQSTKYGRVNTPVSAAAAAAAAAAPAHPLPPTLPPHPSVPVPSSVAPQPQSTSYGGGVAWQPRPGRSSQPRPPPAHPVTMGVPVGLRPQPGFAPLQGPITVTAPQQIVPRPSPIPPAAAGSSVGAGQGSHAVTDGSTDGDLAFALHLQMEEERRAQAERAQMQRPQSAPVGGGGRPNGPGRFLGRHHDYSGGKKKRDCAIM